MTGPSVELFRGIAAYHGFDLSDERIAEAVETHQSIAEGLEALRKIPLPYLEPVPEPSSAIGWIERGVTS